MHITVSLKWLEEEYERLPEEDPMCAPYHYGCHYSNSGTVLHFLLRLPPFTKMFLQYQGKFHIIFVWYIPNALLPVVEKNRSNCDGWTLYLQQIAVLIFRIAHFTLWKQHGGFRRLNLPLT